MNINRLATGSLLAALLVCSVTETLAGTRRHDVADSEHLALAALPEFGSVGKVTTTATLGGELGSGVLIDDDWVLTAAHVITDQISPPTAVTFTINGTDYTAAEWIPHTLWTGENGVATNGYDIALVRLNSPVVGVTPAVRYTGSSELGNVATIVGFGNSGTGLTGQQTGTAGTKRAGPNVLDAFGTHFGNSPNHLMIDFDNPSLSADSHFGSAMPLPLEYNSAQGDSGGGVFIDDGGVQKVAGINSYVHLQGPDGVTRQFSAYGTASGSTRVSTFNGWIDYVMTGDYQSSKRTWTNAAGGSFATNTNWSEGSAPGAAGRAIFNVFGTYTVSMPSDVGNYQIVARNGDVTLDLASHTYTLNNPLFDASIAVAPSSSSGSARLTLTNGTVQAANISVGAPGFTGFSTLQVNAGTTLQASGALEITNNGTVTLNGSPASVGSFTLPTSGTLTGTGQLTVTSGVGNWTGGSMTGTGTTIMGSGTTLNLTGSSAKTLSRTLFNAGTINWTGAGAISGTATINNQAGALFEAQNSASFAGGGTFNNAGTFRKSAGTGTTTVSWSLINTGTVQVQSGTLALASSSFSPVNHTGTFDVSAGATLNLSGGVHNISAGSNLLGAGALVLSNNATLSIAGDNSFNNFSSFEWSGGTLSGSGTTTVTGGSVFNISGSSFKTLGGRTITNNGTINWAGTGGFNGSSGATINNQSGALFDAKDNANFGGGPTTFNNAGTFRKSAGTGTSAIQVVFNNTGQVQAQVGTSSFAGGGTHTGSFEVTSGAMLDFGGSIHNFNGGANLTGAGTLSVSSGTVNVAAAMLNTTGPISLSGSANLSITGDNTFNSLTWNGGTLAGTGTTTIASGGTANVNGGSLNARSLTNLGTLNWTGATSFNAFGGAVINNQSGALLDAQGNGTSSATFNNAGTFRKSAATGVTNLTGVLNNSGAVEVQTGTLRLSSSFGVNSTHSGTFNVSPGATLEFMGGTHNLNAGSNLAGTGTVTLSGATVNVANTTINVTGPLQLNSGTFAVTGDYGLVDNFFWNGGTLGGSGNTTVPNGQVFNIGGTNSRTLSGRTLVNNGTIIRSGTGGLQGSTAVINNAVGALVDLQGDVGFGGGFTSINNAGTLRKSSGTGLSIIESNLLNTGTVDVQVGSLVFSHNGTHSSTFSVAAGSELRFSAGTHNFNAGSNLTGAGTLTIANTFNVAGSMLNTTGPVALNSGQMTVNGDNTFSDVTWGSTILTGAGTTTITGTTTLTGFSNRTLMGRTLNNAGIINAGGSAFTVGNAAIINNQLGAVFDLQGNVGLSFSFGSQPTFNNAGTFKKSAGTGNSPTQWIFNNNGTMRSEQGNIQLNGPFTQSASGRIVLAGGNVSSTSTLSIAAGSLEGTGTVAANTQINGTISPGLFAGRLTFTGNLTLQSSSQTEIDLGGLTAGTLFDQIVVNGAASLSGLLDVDLIDAGLGLFAPSLGDMFEILTATGGVTGTFAALSSPPSAYEFDVHYEANRVLLEVIQVGAGLPGDYNQNGTVDAADYTVWRNNLGSGTALPNDDTAGVGPDDYTRWKANFGASGAGSVSALPSAESLSATVPEPATAILVLAIVMVVVFREIPRHLRA